MYHLQHLWTALISAISLLQPGLWQTLHTSQPMDKKGDSVHSSPSTAGTGQDRTANLPSQVSQVPRALSEGPAHVKEVKNNIQGRTTAALKGYPGKQSMTIHRKQELLKPLRQMTWFVLFMLTSPQHLIMLFLPWRHFPAVFYSQDSTWPRGARRMDLASNLASRLAKSITCFMHTTAGYKTKYVEFFYIHYTSRPKVNWHCSSPAEKLWL